MVGSYLFRHGPAPSQREGQAPGSPGAWPSSTHGEGRSRSNLGQLDPLGGVHEGDAHGRQLVPDAVGFGEVLGLPGGLAGLDHGLYGLVQALLLIVVEPAQHVGGLEEHVQAGLGQGLGGGLLHGDVDGPDQLEDDADGIGGVQVIVHGGIELFPVGVEGVGEGLLLGGHRPVGPVFHQGLQVALGGVQPLQKILQLTFAAGARPAEAGEFTKRAFLNGRIDLTQAEAVMDIIRSRSEASLKLAARQQQGQLAGELRSLRKQLVDIVVNLEAVIDYPEEDIEDVTYGRVQESLSTVCSGIEHLLAHAHTGKILREGLRTAIVGRPNVGKSSLLNALLREERAIVSQYAGTTRDVIEEQLLLDGVPLVLADTAGIRATDDFVEKIGVEKSRQLLADSELVICVIAGSDGLTGGG